MLSLALFFLLLWVSPHSYLEKFLGSIGTVQNPNGTTTSPTQGGIDSVIARLPFAACTFVVCAFAFIALRRKLLEFLISLPQEWRQIREPFFQLFSERREISQELTIVIIVFAIGVFLRSWHLNRPVRYDEAATYLNFVSKPFYRALSNYSYPNNHLFHTFLSRISLLTLGDTLVGLRLPAFVAGCLTIPLVWLTARILYGRFAGILSAGCVAALPTFVGYSVNARGYSMQWNFILVMVLSSAALTMRGAQKSAWLAFVLAAVGGLYSIPTMIVPILAVVFWSLVSCYVIGGFTSARQFVENFALASLAIVLVSALLYFPPLLASGPTAVLANRFISPREDSFWSGLGPLASSTWMRWSDGVPMAIVAILLFGLVLGLVFHRRVSNFAIPITVILWFWSFCFPWARNILGYPRVWNYLLLAAVITSSAGISFLLQTFVRPSYRITVAGTLAITLTLGLGVAMLRERLLFLDNEGVNLIETRPIVEFLRSSLHPGDSLVVNPPADPIIEYGFVHSDPTLYASLAIPEAAHRLVVVLPKPEIASDSYPTNELVGRLVARDAVDPSQASSLIDVRKYAAPRLLAKFLSVTIYSFGRVDSALGASCQRSGISRHLISGR